MSSDEDEDMVNLDKIHGVVEEQPKGLIAATVATARKRTGKKASFKPQPEMAQVMNQGSRPTSDGVDLSKFDIRSEMRTSLTDTSNKTKHRKCVR